MAATATRRGRVPPPRRGRAYYDMDRGVTMIVPPGGGKAVPVKDAEPEKFSAKRALKRSGLLAPRLGRELGRDVAKGAEAVAARQPFNLGTAGGMLIAFAAGLVGLIFLDLLLSPRGSSATAWLIGKKGPAARALQALADPGHPLFAASQPGSELVPRGGGTPRRVISAPVPPGQSSPPAGGRATPLMRPTSSEWGGSKSVASAFAGIALAQGLRVTSEKRETQHTASGGVSDHWVGSKNAYAYDVSGSVGQMDAAARALLAALGIAWDGRSSIVQNVTRFGYRLQILYRTNVGGNHFDHIHIGVRRV